MAARQRRRPTSAAARLAAALLLGSVALALTLRWARPSAAAEPEASPAPALSPASAALAPRPAATSRPELARALQRTVSKWIAKASRESKGKLRAHQAHVAVHVRSLADPRAEIALEADRVQSPASNMKLVTSAAALYLLGPAWSFETAFEAAGEVRGGSLAGDLVVRAGGDPLYDPSAPGSVDALFAPALRALRAAGIAAIEGDLVLDEGTFAAPAPPTGWPDEGQRWAEYCALAGGFSANRGCITVRVTPTQPGRPARVEVEPRHHGLPTSIDVETTSGGKLVIRLDARGRSGLVVRGTIPKGAASWTESCAHPDPVALFGSALAGALASEGIELRGVIRRARGMPAGRPVARISTPLAYVLAPINTDSNNGVADQLFLTLGHASRGQGTRAEAAAATAAALAGLGVPTQGFAQVDGSGLSRENRVSARQVTALFAAVLSLGEPAASLLRGSLAVAGESGTLSDRMQDAELRGRVRAKTGFIAGVSALSGLIEDRSGGEQAFSILVEYPDLPGLNTRCWKPMQDELCGLLTGLAP